MKLLVLLKKLSIKRGKFLVKRALKIAYLIVKCEINFKTIVFNFKYLELDKAIELPIYISNKVYIREMLGKIIIESDLIYFKMIDIGNGRVGIFDEKVSRSIWDVRGTIIFKGSANIGHGAKISVDKYGKLIFGKNFYMTAESSILVTNWVEFGDDCLLSWDILIMDSDFHYIKNQEGEVINLSSPIIIGNKVWIGCRNLIMKGAYIPKNCIIGANSVLTKKLEYENALYAGNPIKVLKKNVSW